MDPCYSTARTCTVIPNIYFLILLNLNKEIARVITRYTEPRVITKIQRTYFFLCLGKNKFLSCRIYILLLAEFM